MHIHHQTFGAGPDPALLLHCGLAHSGAWRPVAAALKDRLTCLAFDMPSHGQSDPWDGIGDIHDLVTGLAQSFLDQPQHVIGHSFGATVALRLAMEQPDKVLTLTLIEPVLFSITRYSDLAVFDAFVARMTPRLEAMTRGDYLAAAEHFIQDWGGGTPWADLSDRQKAQFARQMTLIAASDPVLTRDTPGLTAPGRLEAVACPVLMLRGAKSPPIIAAIQRALAARLPMATQEQVAGAGHMLPMTHPGPVAQAIAAHLMTSAVSGDHLP